MKKLIVLTLIITSLFSVSSCSFMDRLLGGDEDYYKQSNWECTDEEFSTVYYDLYQAKIDELKQVYQIECETLVEHPEDRVYYIYLYSDIFTINFDFYNCNGYGSIKAKLYYFETANTSLDDYESQKPYVDFLNDFINYAGFDTITDNNQFEVLYQAGTTGSEREDKSNFYHYDSLVGNVGYYTILDYDGGGWYYRAEKNKECNLISNVFAFEGLLKPLQ